MTTPKTKTIRRTQVNGRFISTDFVPPSFPKEKSDADFIDSCLVTHFIFESLNHVERVGLIDAMEPVLVKKGTTIMKQGDELVDYFYLIDSGKLEKTSSKVEGATNETLSKGETFGGLALMYNCPRLFTVKSMEDCKLYRLDQFVFKSFLATTESNKSRRLREIISKVDFLKDLDELSMANLIDVMDKLCFKKGELIIKKGDIGDTFYILESGSVKMHDIGHGDSQYVDQILGPGEYFGARSLLTGEKRWMNTSATSNCTLLGLSRDNFEATVGDINKAMEHGMKIRYLKNIPIFANSGFLSSEMSRLAEKMEVIDFEAGVDLSDKISLYIITKGSIVITQLEDGTIHKLNSSDHFGGYNLQEKVKVPKQTVQVKKDSTCYRISKEQILEVIGDIKRLGNPMLPVSKKYDPSIELSHVDKIRMLGMGGFGRVWLATVKGKDPTIPFALKMMDKHQIISADQVQATIREKNIMASVDSIFVANIIGTFQDDYTLYVLCPCIQGGELFTIVHPEEGPEGIPTSSAQFYGACVLEGLAYLHSQNIIYRDLKPENILIDKDGYGVIIDLGFAKIVDSDTYTLCGTPEYLAPEVIKNKGHGKGCDYWSFGVLIFEMLAGASPFNMDGCPPQVMFRRIQQLKYSFPDEGFLSTDEDAQNLIWRLLCPSKAKRLGCLAAGAKDIQNHAWFAEMDFDKLNKKEIKAPWKPDLKDPLDVSAFDNYDDVEDDFSKVPLTKAQHDLFKSFCPEKKQPVDLLPKKARFSFGKLLECCR